MRDRAPEKTAPRLSEFARSFPPAGPAQRQFSAPDSFAVPRRDLSLRAKSPAGVPWRPLPFPFRRSPPQPNPPAFLLRLSRARPPDSALSPTPPASRFFVPPLWRLLFGTPLRL